MKRSQIRIDDLSLPVFSVKNLVIGSGAASLNAAIHLDSLGQDDVMIVTNHWGGGTSNNAGSDKQTYYKLSISGEKRDSPYDMAKTYFEGGGMHGDLGLIESALSAREFFHLVELGVDFPHDKYGQYGGYKTDHDPKGRGTSSGPWTSQEMFSNLADEVERREIKKMDGVEIIDLLTDEKEEKIIGAIGIDKNNMGKNTVGFIVFRSENVVFGVGGPGGLYKDSVYPKGHIGSIGLALKRGAIADSLPEGQFGLASVGFRWNLSGSYQQVLPRYVSVGSDGEEEEFLNKYFDSFEELTLAIFRKGYNWPFDPGRIENSGSSLVDLLVYLESRVKGNKVFLDYTENPSFGEGSDEFDLESLDPEAKQYLKKSDALKAKPIDRLEALNPDAIELFEKNGIDLESEPLEVSVCVQHNNGGLKGNIWWESNIDHLFPVGEVNGSHGVSRPGGSALNAGQVGGLRAAQYINAKYDDWSNDREEFEKMARPQIEETHTLAMKMLDGGGRDIENVRSSIQKRMSDCAGILRDPNKIEKGLEEAKELLREIREGKQDVELDGLCKGFQNFHLAISQVCYLSSILWYIREGGGSRGSYIVVSEDGNKEIKLENFERNYREENEKYRDKVQETCMVNWDEVENKWVQRRPIPEEEFWFESVWKDYADEKVFEK